MLWCHHICVSNQQVLHNLKYSSQYCSGWGLKDRLRDHRWNAGASCSRLKQQNIHQHTLWLNSCFALIISSSLCIGIWCAFAWRFLADSACSKTMLQH